jgi:serine/threonine protein kinase
VKLARKRDSDKVLAVKIMRKDKVHSVKDLKRVQNEIAVLKKVRHPNIVAFVDVIFSPTYVYLFVEKGGKDLFEFFSAHLEGVDHETAMEIILGITLPIAYLHSMNICHRDLKPENVLLKVGEEGKIECGMIQICDFGLCQKVKPGAASMLTEFCGSPGFFAPEMVLKGGKYDGLLVDVWSIGCIMLELTLGHERFCKKWMSAYDFEIIQRPSSFEDSIEYAVDNLDFVNMSDAMKDFINDVLVIKPSERTSSENLLNSLWFEGHPSLPANMTRSEQPRRVHLDSMDVQSTDKVRMNDRKGGQGRRRQRQQ